MKQMFFGLAFICSVASFAQSGDLTVTNNTTCYFRLDVEAYDSNCDDRCGVYFICIPPGTTVVRACGSGSLSWDNLRLTPADSRCNYCPGFTPAFVTSSFGNGCTTFAASADVYNRCGDCSGTVTFSSANVVTIN